MSLPVIAKGDLATLVTFFGNGYAYRHALLTQRGARNEPEIHTLVMSVVASIFLAVLFSVGYIPIPHWMPDTLRLPLALGSRLGLSFLIGLSIAKLAATPPIKKYDFLRKLVGDSECQSIIQFLNDTAAKDTEGKDAIPAQFVRFKTCSGHWYVGRVDYFDKDPERFKDLHIVFVQLWKIEDDGKWRKLDELSQMIVSVEDIEVLQAEKRPPPKPSG